MPDPKDQVNTKYSIFLNRLPPIGLLLYIDTLIYALLWCVGSRKLDFPQFRELFKARKFPETKKSKVLGTSSKISSPEPLIFEIPGTF